MSSYEEKLRELHMLHKSTGGHLIKFMPLKENDMKQLNVTIDLNARRIVDTRLIQVTFICRDIAPAQAWTTTSLMALTESIEEQFNDMELKIEKVTLEEIS